MNSNPVYSLFYNKAVQLLAQRNHSSIELKQKLQRYYFKIQNLNASQLPNSIIKIGQSQKQKNEFEYDSFFIESQIQQVIDYCIKSCWINDSDYIEQYFLMRARKGYGQNKILMELKEKKLSSILIQNILEKIKIDWIFLGLNQARKKFPNLDKKEIKQKLKFFQFLKNRGFQMDEINEIFLLF